MAYEELPLNNGLAAVTERFNKELIWGVGASHSADLQQISMPRLENWHPVREDVVKACLAPTLDTAELFYTNHGVPINEDKEWVETGRYANRSVTAPRTFMVYENASGNSIASSLLNSYNL